MTDGTWGVGAVPTVCSVAGKNFLRAAQMNMNFSTWGRLMMSILPPCSSSLEPMSPPDPAAAPRPAPATPQR